MEEESMDGSHTLCPLLAGEGTGRTYAMMLSVTSILPRVALE